MATRTLSYGDAVTPTITLDTTVASHATNGRKSTAVTCAGEPMGVLECTFAIANSGSIANDRGVHVWIAQSSGGTKYEDELTAGDAVATPGSVNNLRYLGAVACEAIGTTFSKEFMIFEPRKKFIVVVRNFCGTTLAATGSSIKYYPITETFA